nr:unnamed protein product [Timema genevievae]
MSQPIGISTDKDLEEELATLLESSGSSGPSDNTPHHTASRAVSRLDQGAHAEEKKELSLLATPYDSPSEKLE